MARIATGTSVSEDSDAALRGAYATLCERLGGEPTWTMLGVSATHDLERVRMTWSEVCAGHVHGLTSSGGVMTEEGASQGRSMSLFGILDEEGSYGTSAALVEDDVTGAAQEALLAALGAAGRDGELPALIWMSCSPGYEEEVIAGLEEVVGDGVTIAGGSAADDAIAGQWRLFDREQLGADAVVISVMFPSMGQAVMFQSGFAPTEHVATVTAATGRLLQELDGRPAADVYDEWTGGAISSQRRAGEGMILSETSLHPLGRVVGDVASAKYHLLSHPASVEADGSLALFTDIEVGDEVILMKGSSDRLVERAGRLARQVISLHSVPSERILGGLVIYCAGCMMNVSDRLGEVVDGLQTGLEQRPFLGTFTFGEQGCFVGGENRHGNLMITVLVFFDEGSSS